MPRDRTRHNHSIDMKRAGAIIAEARKPENRGLSHADLARRIGTKEFHVRHAKQAFRWGETVQLELSKIRRDGGLQPRAELNPETIAEYQEQMKAGKTAFPPVTVYYDGEDYWLADGYHRFEAARRAGFKRIEADVKQGDRRRAILFSVGANAKHGLRRTNADKRRAVETMLRDEEWVGWSDPQIAQQTGVDHKTVMKIRGELQSRWEIPNVEQRKGKDGKTYDVSRRSAERTRSVNVPVPDPEPDPAPSPRPAVQVVAEPVPSTNGFHVHAPVSAVVESDPIGADNDTDDVDADSEPTASTEEQAAPKPVPVRHTCPTCRGRGYIEGDQ